MSNILGLDLGTNSIGWAVVNTEDNEQFSLVDKGVRIFQEGVKIEKGVEGSKAAERTEYRSARRIKFRRKLRKIETLKVLVQARLCPLLSDDVLRSWRYKRIYPQNESFRHWLLTDSDNNLDVRKSQRNNPYYYRYLAASEKLNLSDENNRFLLGRAFYHMAQRRGFLSNRLETTKESDGAVQQDIDRISEAKGELTLGQYFYHLYQKGEKIRDHYTHREDHYLQEFNQICQVQELDAELITQLRKAIFYQRPLKSQKGLIGKCPLEPKKQRCAVSHPTFEEFRMLSLVNNIKIKTPDDIAMRSLNGEERSKAIARFYLKRDQFNFEDIAKQLAPKKQYKYFKAKDIQAEDWLFNYDMGTSISGCPLSARFLSIFGEDWRNLKIEHVRKDHTSSTIDINDVWHVLNTFDSHKKLEDFALEKLHLTTEQVKELCNKPLKQDFGSLSLKAINKILPYLRQGLIYSHAVFLANVDQLIPDEVWNDSDNRTLIKNEIEKLIQSQNHQRQIVEIVNSIIKQNKQDKAVWSEEAKELYHQDLLKQLKSFYGANTYSKFTSERKEKIETEANDLLTMQIQKNNGCGEFAKALQLDERILQFLDDQFGPLNAKAKLYHPSAIETYKKAVADKNGRYQLGSPLTSSVRNPMAMRALHQLRKVVNELLQAELIDENTAIHIEMARSLMNANERKGLQNYQRKQEADNKKYAEEITAHFQAQGINTEPSDDDILKYRLWEEQNHICIYTGQTINLSDFLGASPKYDIEHTIPRSLSFDNSQVNLTLCDNEFNRKVKGNKIPADLDNSEIFVDRIVHWKEQYEKLKKQINGAVRAARTATTKEAKDSQIIKRHQLNYEYQYWKNKYDRFTRTDVPAGFKNSQLVDTGIITKYARLYLKTVFDRVYTVKGSTVADFRKFWGLQDAYKTKARVNHIHHCIDAVTIACMGKQQYDQLARFYHEWEDLREKGHDKKPRFSKPWPTFTEDVKQLEQEVLVSHYTPDNLPKSNRKILRKRGKKQTTEQGKAIIQTGDSVRGSLHKETFYGAIEREVMQKNGETEKVIKYVLRKAVTSLSDAEIKNIVDDTIRQIVADARKQEKVLLKEIEELNKKLKKAEENEEPTLKAEIEKLNRNIEQLYSLPNKNGAPVPIKKVRVYQPTVTNPLHIKQQRDKNKKNPKPYKEHFHAANDGNYLMAIYEGVDNKGKVKRDFELINNMAAAEYFKLSVQGVLKPQGIGNLEGLIPKNKQKGKLDCKHKANIKAGTMVILWEQEPQEVWELEIMDVVKRMYKVVGLSINRIKSGKKIFEFGNIVLRHHLEAKPASELKTYDGLFQKEEPFISQRKLSHNQFNALIEGVDFKISSLGKIEQLK